MRKHIFHGSAFVCTALYGRKKTALKKTFTCQWSILRAFNGIQEDLYGYNCPFGCVDLGCDAFAKHARWHNKIFPCCLMETFYSSKSKQVSLFLHLSIALAPWHHQTWHHLPWNRKKWCHQPNGPLGVVRRVREAPIRLSYSSFLAGIRWGESSVKAKGSFIAGGITGLEQWTERHEAY